MATKKQFTPIQNHILPNCFYYNTFMLMKKWVAKYSGVLRNLRITYWLYNLFNFYKLKKNKHLYQQLGVQKKIWQSIAHADIKNISTNIPWMDKPETSPIQIQQKVQLANFATNLQQQFLNWQQNGYIIIPNFFTNNQVNDINTEIEKLQQLQQVDFNFTGKKIMDAWQHSQTINDAFKNTELLKIFEFIFQKKPIPFQTINFIYGSEQKPHSDSIHMTTEPLGYLAAVWIALEDIQPNSGELVYYPGSHKLNYVMSEHYNTGNNALLIGEHNYNNYEQKIDEIIQQHKFKPHYFHAKKGDILIWHANLLHGGSIIKNKTLTRKSMVAHYYAEDVLCYHEISQRPAVIKQKN